MGGWGADSVCSGVEHPAIIGRATTARVMKRILIGS
jgi:hypothetical protein